MIANKSINALFPHNINNVGISIKINIELKKMLFTKALICTQIPIEHNKRSVHRLKFLIVR